MASAGDDNEICEEDEDTANNAAKVSSNNEGMRRSSSDSKIKKLRRKISQGLRLSFIKDENDVSNISEESQIENDVFDSNSNPSLTSSKLAARPVVRRSASDSIGARLRKISFEIGSGRRHSDDLSPDELKNMPQALALLKAKEPSHAIQQYAALSLVPFAIFWEEFGLKTSVITFYGIRYFCGQHFQVPGWLSVKDIKLLLKGKEFASYFPKWAM